MAERQNDRHIHVYTALGYEPYRRTNKKTLTHKVISMRYVPITIVAAGLVFFGASCQSVTTNITPATNTAGNSNTASHTTGSFSTTPTTDPADVTITVTSSGLDRPTVDVNPGDVIEFRNSDTKTHTIDADPHPSHSSLANFGATIAPGGTYRYVCTDVGTFTYHDEDAPNDYLWQGTLHIQSVAQ